VVMVFMIISSSSKVVVETLTTKIDLAVAWRQVQGGSDD
jgi:hypothetical protein